MKLQLREHPQPAPSLLEALWSFVSGRMDVEAFEISVYDHLDGLEALLASDTAEQLLALNYATVDADVLRRTIKQAIEGIPTSCECVKIPPAVVLDTGFLARIDGAGPMRFFKDILLPLSRTSMAALFVIQFIYGWNQYLWPLIVTTSEDMYPIVLGIKRAIFGEIYVEWNVVMATAILAMIPPALVVVLMQKWFVKGLVDTEK